MPGPWEKYQKVGSGPWEKYKTFEAPKRPEKTMVESGLHGAAQGATMGYADELEGALKGAYDVTFGDSKLGQIAERYRANRDTARGRYEKARQDNPGSYLAGEVAGGVGTAFLPGFGWANAVKGASTAAKIGTAAKVGAVAGLGQSTADITKGQLGKAAEDTATGAAIGGVTQGVLSGIGAGLKHLTPTNAARKMSNVFLNTPEEITETYIKNPEGVLSAPKRFELAGQYDDVIAKLKGEVQEGSQASRNILTQEAQTVKGAEIASILNSKADDIAARAEGIMDDPETLAAYKWLKDRAGMYAEKGDADLSTNRVKDILQSIDRSVDFETAPGKFGKIDDTVKKGVRSDVDYLLKGRSPAYAEQMKGVAEDTRLLNEASDIARTPQGLANVFRRLQTDQYGGGQVPREVLERLDKRMGTDILEQAKLSTAREAFDKSVTNGSRNVNFFSNLMKDVPVVKYAAPIVGGTVDKYGRKLTMGAVDTAVKLNKLYQSQGVQSFIEAAQPVIDAARKGNPSAILTFQMLSQSNPEALRYLDQNNE